MVLLGFAVSWGCALLGALVVARKVTASLEVLMRGIREIGHGNFDYKTTLESHDEFEEMANEINQMTLGLKERERLKLNFARYVSHQVMEKAMASEQGAKLEGEEKKITILFSDIRHFTQIAEERPPEQVVALLNEYFDQMLDIIFRHEGTLDKFLGDGILVEFGAPFDDLDQEKHAVSAAIEMQYALKKMREEWEKRGDPAIHMGIGIHTGTAIVGNIGTEKRLEYTAIGDTVNIALAIENANKQFNTQILLSESTFQAVQQLYKTKPLGPIDDPEKKEKVNVYSIEDYDA
jgi:adenylate cyclase